MKLYNTLTRRIEDFVPHEAGKVKMYTCGPTVYNFAHIGNLRTYMMEDVLEQFAAEQSGRIKVCSMEEEQAAQLMDYYGVDRVPAFLAFYNGKVTGVIVGGTSKEALESMFRRK